MNTSKNSSLFYQQVGNGINIGGDVSTTLQTLGVIENPKITKHPNIAEHLRRTLNRYCGELLSVQEVIKGSQEQIDDILDKMVEMVSDDIEKEKFRARRRDIHAYLEAALSNIAFVTDTPYTPGDTPEVA